jgi:glycosyltransferase involved in cell wall biosynthesis
MIGYVPQEHLIGLYSGASLVVNGSLCEGFGLPVLEALACGAIVAVAQNTSLPEVGGSAVACFDPLDINDMVEVIYTALTDERLRQTLRSASTAQVSKFTWTQTALNTLSIYKGNGIVYK